MNLCHWHLWATIDWSPMGTFDLFSLEKCSASRTHRPRLFDYANVHKNCSNCLLASHSRSAMPRTSANRGGVPLQAGASPISPATASRPCASAYQAWATDVERMDPWPQDRCGTRWLPPDCGMIVPACCERVSPLKTVCTLRTSAGKLSTGKLVLKGTGVGLHRVWKLCMSVSWSNNSVIKRTF